MIWCSLSASSGSAIEHQTWSTGHALAGFGGWLADAGMAGAGLARPGNPLDQIPEDVSVSRAERGQQFLLGRGDALSEGQQSLLALVSDHDLAGPPVGWVRAALDEVGRLQLVEQVGHDR